MSKDFSSDQGGIQSSSSIEFDKQEGGTPTVGFSEAPKVEQPSKGPGPGIGSTRKGIS